MLISMKKTDSIIKITKGLFRCILPTDVQRDNLYNRIRMVLTFQVSRPTRVEFQFKHSSNHVHDHGHGPAWYNMAMGMAP